MSISSIHTQFSHTMWYLLWEAFSSMTLTGVINATVAIVSTGAGTGAAPHVITTVVATWRLWHCSWVACCGVGGRCGCVYTVICNKDKMHLMPFMNMPSPESVVHVFCVIAWFSSATYCCSQDSSYPSTDSWKNRSSFQPGIHSCTCKTLWLQKQQVEYESGTATTISRIISVDFCFLLLNWRHSGLCKNHKYLRCDQQDLHTGR